ncbi:MAG TPA: hypothetical protein VET90_05480 [Candidatus Binatus sp.]|nr:hypothetical protein [Candidatus Binatus sp.]
MQLLHQFLGFVAVAGAIVGIAWCAWVALQPATAVNGRFLTWFGYAIVAVAVIAAITGAFRQGSGGTPGATHPLFAAVSVVAVPVARYLSMLAPRREAWVWLVGYVLLGLAMVGLFLTG